ncbi:chemotaxis-specific protein-glutamate methyltransferase CheB [Erythrobacter sp. GH1-10]|uniref:chemotaxis-specific protein-glutamate methyltransferase CheB n=1 Tax=Erythrobacter sp. GH1-10 TaxID=3349334 RepID=UPI00387834CE
MAVRVMIVDDSLTVRTIFKRMVESDRNMAIAGTASSAERAIAQLRTTPADVILLDLEMPGMGGLDALPAILETAEGAQVLVVSSLTEDGAEATMAALSMGAADTMLKPRPGGFNEDYRTQLLGKIRALGSTASEAAGGAPTATERLGEETHLRSGKRPEVLAVGASTGGIHALNLMLRAIPPEFNLPILVTQHLPASFVSVFARQIETVSARRTVVAEDGTEIRPGEVVIAAGHGHMIVRRVGERLIAKVSSEPAQSGCMPSVDPMLNSLAHACGGRVLAVILSGMGRDGLSGAQDLVERGGTVFAQDADTSAVWGMPGAVAKAGLASLVAAPEALAGEIASFARLPVSR